MENLRSRKLRTIKMKYPAPYSHSFLSTEPLQNVTRKMKKYTSFQGNNKRVFQSPCCRTCPKPITQGCNPYAPHLKYGVFPRKTRRYTKSIQIAWKKSETENIPINKSYLLGDGKMFYKKGQHSCPPLLRPIRPIDKTLTHQLSLSGVMHVDIKPSSAVKKLQYKNMSTKFSSNRFLRNKVY